MRREENLSSSGVTTGPQFEQALSVAETLMTQADQVRERTHRALIGQTAVIAVAIVTIAIVVGISDVSSIHRLLVSIVVGFVGFAVAAAIQVAVRVPLGNQLERDAQAAVDIVSLLREVFPLVSDVENWNETQVRLADTRLSRFPIG
jgi:hypothetical protein